MHTYNKHGASLVAQLVKKRRSEFDSWVGMIPWRRDRLPTPVFQASLVAQLVKNLPAVQETWVWSLGWEDPLEECMETYSSILAWRFPVDREAWWALVHGVTQTQTRLSDWAQQASVGSSRLLTNASESPANARGVRDVGSIPGPGRCPAGGVAAHSSVLAWRIPWTEGPGRLQSTGSQRVSTEAT